MKTILLLFTFSVFSLLGQCQKTTDIVLFDLDSIENYLMDQIRINDISSDLAFQLGKELVEKFQKDTYNHGDYTPKGFRNKISYLTDFQEKLKHLDSCYGESLIFKTEIQRKNIQELIEQNISEYNQTNNCILINSNTVLFCSHEIKNVTHLFIRDNFKNSISNHWIKDQVNPSKYYAWYFFEYHKLINHFTNHPSSFVRFLWESNRF